LADWHDRVQRFFIGWQIGMIMCKDFLLAWQIGMIMCKDFLLVYYVTPPTFEMKHDIKKYRLGIVNY